MAGFLQSLSGNKNNPIGQANELAAQYQSSGLFDPNGSSRLRALRRRAAIMRRGSMRQANQGAAQLYGLDPMQARAAMTQGDVYGNAQLTGDLANAELQTQQEQNAFGRNLFMGNLDYARQRQLQKEAAKQQQQGALGQMLGGLGGAALSFIPGIGPALGGMAGAASKGYGSNNPQSQYFMGPQDPYNGSTY